MADRPVVEVEGEELISDLSTVKGLTLPTGIEPEKDLRQVLIQAQGGAVRIRFGTDPDGTTGLILAKDDTMVISRSQAEVAKFIQDSGATSTLYVAYLGVL